MKKIVSILTIISALVLIQGCAKIYHTTDYKSIAAKQQIIAITPPKVSIAAQRKVETNAILEQQKTESINFQKEMYSWLLKRKMQGRMTIELQDIETTNAILAEVGVNDGKVYTPYELCDVLRVDGILTSNYSLSKPMSEGAAVVVALLVGVWGATNETTVTLSIHDFGSGKMIWNYNHKLSSSMSSPSRLVDALMRQASKKMPYFISYDY